MPTTNTYTCQQCHEEFELSDEDIKDGASTEFCSPECEIEAEMENSPVDDTDDEDDENGEDEENEEEVIVDEELDEEGEEEENNEEEENEE